MSISIDLWRSRTGNFNSRMCYLRQSCRFKVLYIAFCDLLAFIKDISKLLLAEVKQYLLLIFYHLCLILWCSYFCVVQKFLNSSTRFIRNHFVSFYSYFWWTFLLIAISNMSLVNPGPTTNVRKYPLKILHLNPNSITAHDGARIHAIEALNTIHNYDVIAVTESALHSSISNDVIQLNGFIPIRRDLLTMLPMAAFYYTIRNP